MTITYKVGEGLYVNLTNRCSNRCSFCVRNFADNVNGKDALWLDREPTFDEALADIKKHGLKDIKELVFCGFGEPTFRIDDVVALAREVKRLRPSLPVRINTNGQANLINGRDVTPELEGAIDVLSISLNSSTAEGYDRLCRSDYGRAAFDAVLDFARRAKKYVPDVRMSVVDILPADEIERCRAITEELGVKLRVRKMIKKQP